MREVVVIGAGLHPYGIFNDKSVSSLGTEAIGNALRDANMSWEDIEVAYCGTVQPSMSAGHAVCQEMGLTGLAITNVEKRIRKSGLPFNLSYRISASSLPDFLAPHFRVVPISALV